MMGNSYRVVFTRGEGFDCPPERECWVELEDEKVADRWLRAFPLHLEGFGQAAKVSSG